MINKLFKVIVIILLAYAILSFGEIRRLNKEVVALWDINAIQQATIHKLVNNDRVRQGLED